MRKATSADNVLTLVSQTPVRQQVPQSWPFRASKPGNPIRILVADVSATLFERLSELLAAFPGVNIAGRTTDVLRTMRHFAERHPDIVILDLNIAGGSGIDVLRDIKRTNPQTTVVVLTSSAYPQYRLKCMDLGADSFLDKSMEFEKVPGSVGELAEERRSNTHPSRTESSLSTSLRTVRRRGASCRRV